MGRVRCAIYTRKSSDEGLEQDFNSLDAQYEACSAYILSQASEGWNAINKRYDDGGVSGGTLERPALKRLIADIASGLVDIVVVYKIDRLTRSLLDFAKLVEAFDEADTSFVSITQSFNTTTSMGRLTLNMLLSFAQFEREVTAERIRDKISASKAKGMWMGGTPPIGYAPDGRTLKIVEDHADLVRNIYRRYLALGNVRLLEEQLEAECITVPKRTALSGKQTGGGRFYRGQLYTILDNPIYKGEIRHKDLCYAGLHPFIIDPDQWEQVKLKRQDNVRGHRSLYQASHRSILAGKLYDEQDRPLIAAHACKGKKRYRYYVSRHMHHKTSEEPGWRIPAKEIEGLVSIKLKDHVSDPIGLFRKLKLLLPSPDHMPALLERASKLADKIGKGSPSIITKLVSKISLSDQSVTVSLSINALAVMLKVDVPTIDQTHIFTIDAKLTRTGLAMKLVQHSGNAPVHTVEADTLLKNIARGQQLWKRLCGEHINILQLAKAEGISKSYISRIIRLAFIDPYIIEQIIAGKQPAMLDTSKLTISGTLPIRWEDQRKFAGLSPKQ